MDRFREFERVLVLYDVEIESAFAGTGEEMNGNTSPANAGSNGGLGPLSERWYCINSRGVAALCADERDAKANAANCDKMYPAYAPHRAVLLGDVSAERERCAKLCEQEHAESGEHPEMALHCAERIRGLRAQAVGIPVHRRGRPLVWARKDQLQHASTRGGLMCAMYPHTYSRADLQPLYDQAALDAAVAAERERCAKIVDMPPGTEAWEVIGGEEGLTMLRELAALIRSEATLVKYDSATDTASFTPVEPR